MIQVDQLSKSFNQHLVLDKLNLNLERGERIVMTGNSGAGKTTLLRMLAGFESADQGTIHIDGELASSPKVLVAPRERGIGLVFQQPQLWPHMRVKQQVRYGAGGDRQEKENTVRQLAADFEIKHVLKKYPAELSMGEQRRVAIARALASDPAFLFIDEGLVNLDPLLRSSLVSTLIALQKQKGFALLLVTHIPTDQQVFEASRIHLKNGQLIKTDVR